MANEIPINKRLLWDYDIPDDAQENEGFRRLYITRVLTRGTDSDLQAITFKTIHHYLPQIFLPKEIHEFWHWYFSLPDVIARYGHLNPIPAEISQGIGK